ncbi:MFS transporter [Aureibacter tunicatorum]|uniref:MFS family arabinose efflux permease n=1 Tax=Aureibacter tunicatorum TaxID=866807 RepID=A0AAE3XPD6_9BACT|nr:MFS transporter [Aureibacter tunicatorum]MDR6238834.1 putative MFS family arabinose efflux permease [Aureibacter tunicatorum]BDD05239.1 MFS transporter [Aureibacter tunicatorum]
MYLRAILSYLRKGNPMYTFLFLLTTAAAIGFQGWRTLFNNFAVDEIGLNGLQIGGIQSFREVPGFLVFTAVFILMLVKEEKFILWSTLIMGLGIMLTGLFPSFWGLMMTTFIMSVGFHYYETINQSLTLQHFDTLESPKVFANLRSVTAVANIFVGGMVYLLSQVSDFQQLYIVLGALVIGIAIWAYIKMPNVEQPVPQNKKMIIKKEYWLFYALNVLSGARRQIFVVFAVLLLVEKYGFSLMQITMLFVLNNIIAIFTNPLIAKYINKFGEKKMLGIEYISLALIFIAYATIESAWVAAFLYLLDHVFFNFSIGIKTYFQKTADPKDIAPSMAVGFAINHVAAVVLPVVGGFIWLINWKLPFIGAFVLCLLSLIVVKFMKSKEELTMIQTTNSKILEKA